MEDNNNNTNNNYHHPVSTIHRINNKQCLEKKINSRWDNDNQADKQGMVGWGRLWRGNIFFNYNVIHIFATFSHSLPFTSLTPSFLQSKQVLLVEHTPKPNNNHPKYNREWKEVKKTSSSSAGNIIFLLGLMVKHRFLRGTLMCSEYIHIYYYYFFYIYFQQFIFQKFQKDGKKNRKICI